MRKSYILLSVLAVMISVTALASCSQDDCKETDLSLTLVVADRLGDKNSADSVLDGVTRLNEDYGITIDTVECDLDNFKDATVEAAKRSDIVVLIGNQFTDMAEVAAEYSDTKFIWIDNTLEDVQNYENVLCVTYDWSEGAFLIGYVAARMTKNGIVGAVGVKESAETADLVAGFEQGAGYADTEIRVIISYTEADADTSEVKACALDLYSQGADVIFQTAGNAGEGVFEAAKEKGFYAIGVDVGLKLTSPEYDAHIICSMKKEYGNSVYDIAKAMIEDGTWYGGRVWTSDMSSGYMSIIYGSESSVQHVSDKVKSEVELISSKIISGEIKVNTIR